MKSQSKTRSRSKKSKNNTRKNTVRPPTYPYKRTFMNYDDIIARAKVFEPLILTDNKKYNLTKEQKKLFYNVLKVNKGLSKINKNIYILVTDNASEYVNYDINYLTDNFSEECRVRCRVETEPYSPYESFQKFHDENIAGAIRKYGDSSPRSVNLYMDNHGFQARMCTNYKLTYLLGLMKIFKPRKWLDLSAGWGDRLLAAVLGGVKYYCGVDPNDCLHPCYKKIIDTLVPEADRSNFKMINAESQKLDTNFVNMKFDFIFTSPPFFTFEEYEGAAANRQIYNSMDKWLTDFMFKTVDLAWNKLEDGGKYGLYIEDKPNYRFMKRLLEYIESKPGAQYMGIVYQLFLRKSNRYEYKLRNVYFFTKVKTI